MNVKSSRKTFWNHCLFPLTFSPTTFMNTKSIASFERLRQQMITKAYISPPNLTKSERTALYEMMGDRDIVIKPADNGGGICIQDSDKYKQEILSQLSNSRFYEKLHHDPTFSFWQEILSYLEDAIKKGWISESRFDFQVKSFPSTASSLVHPHTWSTWYAVPCLCWENHQNIKIKYQWAQKHNPQKWLWLSHSGTLAQHDISSLHFYGIEHFTLHVMGEDLTNCSTSVSLAGFILSRHWLLKDSVMNCFWMSFCDSLFCTFLYRFQEAIFYSFLLMT